MEGSDDARSGMTYLREPMSFCWVWQRIHIEVGLDDIGEPICLLDEIMILNVNLGLQCQTGLELSLRILTWC